MPRYKHPRPQCPWVCVKGQRKGEQCHLSISRRDPTARHCSIHMKLKRASIVVTSDQGPTPEELAVADHLCCLARDTVDLTCEA
jgi:mitochondrial fission protein ELM1